MALFDKFTSKFKPPKGYSEVKFDFTEEESEAINRNLKMYGSIANEDAPQGMVACIPEKARNGIIAQALCQYVEDLMRGWQRSSGDVMDKAIKAQIKAYAVHNLPVYLFQVAGMFEHVGDATNAKEFYRQFLETQRTFHPDSIDTSFLNQMDFDIPTSVAVAKQKLR